MSRRVSKGDLPVGLQRALDLDALKIDHLSTIIIVAGLSGAGKSLALDSLEDLGYFTVEHLPVSLLVQFLDSTRQAPSRYARTAVLPQLDSAQSVSELGAMLKSIAGTQCRLEVLFLDCQRETIVKRYGETRRPHPGFDPSHDKTLLEAVEREKQFLFPLKEHATAVIDTTAFTVHELRREVKKFAEMLGERRTGKVRINFVSFGFKYGIPIDCDLLMDVRFLPNPHFVDRLRSQTGLDKDVADYVLQSGDAQEFIDRYTGLLEFLLPRYVFEGKSYINVGVGCTGGRHRSVAVAEALQRRVDNREYLVSIQHRDVDK